MAADNSNSNTSSNFREFFGTQITDSHDPLFLHPSDSPSVNLVGKVFDGSSYAGWRRAMLIALSAKNKLCFVDGCFPKPDSYSPLVQIWEMCNNMAISWILNALEKEISESVLNSSPAEEIWKELECRFGQPNGALLYIP
ncbi:hypothetical protein Ancab_039783 [Ancistrocladus abbreviatus]